MAQLQKSLSGAAARVGSLLNASLSSPDTTHSGAERAYLALWPHEGGHMTGSRDVRPEAESLVGAPQASLPSLLLTHLRCSLDLEFCEYNEKTHNSFLLLFV